MDYDPQEETGHPRRWLILCVLCFSLCVIIIDETILYIAVPALFEHLGASNGQVQWAIDAYIILYAALLLPAGNLGDRYGRRTFLLIGLGVFGLASLIAAWAPSPDVLIAARAVMAVGGALIMPQTLSILTEVFPASQRGLAIGVWSGISGVGIMAGPIVGGLLIEHFWWGSVFLVNVPVVALAAIGAVSLLPNHRDRSVAPADFAGSLAAVIALVCLLAAVIEAPGRGLTHPFVWGGAGVGLVAALSFVAIERRRVQPMLDLALLRVPSVVLSLTVIGVSFAALQGSSYALTQYLQLVQGRGAAQAGLLFAPTTIAWSASAPLSPTVVRRFGVTAVLRVTMTVTAVSYVGFGLCGPGTATWILLVLFGIQGVTMGLSVTPLTDLLMGSVARGRAGVASALNDVSRQVGGAVGVAVFGAVLGAVFISQVGPSGPDNLAQAVSGAFGGLGASASDAFMSGYRVTMFIAAASFVLVIPVIVRRNTSRRDAGTA